MRVQPRLLVALLTPAAHRILERALALAAARRHYEVGLQHLLHEMLAPDAGAEILLGPERAEALRVRVEAELESFRVGDQRPVFHGDVFRLLERAWLHASVELGRWDIDPGALLQALARSPDLVDPFIEPGTLGRMEERRSVPSLRPPPPPLTPMFCVFAANLRDLVRLFTPVEASSQFTCDVERLTRLPCVPLTSGGGLDAETILLDYSATEPDLSGAEFDVWRVDSAYLDTVDIETLEPRYIPTFDRMRQSVSRGAHVWVYCADKQ